MEVEHRHYRSRETVAVEIESECTARDREWKAIGGPEAYQGHPPC